MSLCKYTLWMTNEIIKEIKLYKMCPVITRFWSHAPHSGPCVFIASVTVIEPGQDPVGQTWLLPATNSQAHQVRTAACCCDLTDLMFRSPGHRGAKDPQEKVEHGGGYSGPVCFPVCVLLATCWASAIKNIFR